MAGEERGLVIAAAQEAQPVQGDGGHDHAGVQDRLRGAKEPARGRAGQIGAVAVFQRQGKLAPLAGIEHGRTPPLPWPGEGEAIVALDRGAVFTGKGGAAGIADKAGDERRITPAGGA